jgi:VanZ family protein
MAERNYRRVWLALGWTGIAGVVALSLIPNLPHSGISGGDKVGHLLAYFALMFWFGLLYAGRLAWALAFLVLGAALELLQGLTGYREASLADLVANTSGIALGWLAACRCPQCLSLLEAKLP